MPRLSPSAARSASPSASAQSSTVWCSSMCEIARGRRARARNRRASRAARACDRRSRCRWRRGSDLPRSRSTRTSMSVSFVCAYDGRAAREQFAHGGRPGLALAAVLAHHAGRACRGSRANSQVGVAVADHGAARGGRRVLARDTRAAVPVFGLRQSQPSALEVRADEDRVELDSLEREGVEDEALAELEIRGREGSACRGRPGWSPSTKR